MKIFATSLLLIASAFAPTAAKAQVNAGSTPLTLYNQCLSNAIANNRTVKSGTSIHFTCSGAVAKTFFDTMGSYGISAFEWKDPSRNETFRVRKVDDSDGADYCMQQVATSDGSAATSFKCIVMLSVGPFLNR